MFHFLNQEAVKEPSNTLCACRRLMNRARHFAYTWIKSHPPSDLPRCSVDKGTLKIAPRHMNHAMEVLSWRMRSAGAGKIWATYHVRANKDACTNFIVMARFMSLQ